MFDLWFMLLMLMIGIPGTFRGELHYRGGYKVTGIVARFIGILALIALGHWVLIYTQVLPNSGWLIGMPCGVMILFTIAGVFWGTRETTPASIQESVAFICVFIGCLAGSFLKSAPDTLTDLQLGRVVLTSVVFAAEVVVVLGKKAVAKQDLLAQVMAGMFLGGIAGYIGESVITLFFFS